MINLFHSDFKKIFENLSAKRDNKSGVDKKMNSNAETELAPLRSLDDFILSQSRLNLMHILSEIKASNPCSRFQVPEYQNIDKFRNRIVSNLIYYQTNYALSSVLLFSLITFLNPFKMFLGMSTMALCNFTTNKERKYSTCPVQCSGCSTWQWRDRTK